mgnify:CR=1 FL=1
MGTLNLGSAPLSATGANWNDAPPGTVIQYVQATHTVMTVRFDTTSTSYVDSGYSITITPRNTSSQILIYANISCYCTNNRYGYLRVYNSTAGRYVNVEGGVTNDGMYESAQGGQSQWSMMPVEAIDLPGSTSAQTYKIYTRSSNSGGTMYCGWSSSAPNTMNMNFMSATEYSA